MIDKKAFEEAEITFIAVSLTCEKSGKHPLKEAIMAYESALQPVVDEQAVICAINTVMWAETEDDYQAEDIYKAIRPYLRQTRPKDEAIKDMAAVMWASDAIGKPYHGVLKIFLDESEATQLKWINIAKSVYEAEHGF
jgi:hypothetical protein